MRGSLGSPWLRLFCFSFCLALDGGLVKRDEGCFGLALFCFFAVGFNVFSPGQFKGDSVLFSVLFSASCRGSVLFTAVFVLNAQRFLNGCRAVFLFFVLFLF